MKPENNSSQDKEILTKLIYEKFQTLNLNKEQYSRLINRSIPSIDRDRANSRGSKFHKDSKNRVYYPVHCVVDYLLDVNITLNY